MNARMPILSALVILALAGCTALSPQPSVTPEATPAPDRPDATSIDLSATEFTISFVDGTTQTVAFGSPAEEILEALTGALGEPEIEEFPEEQCVPEHSIARWSGGVVMTWGDEFYYRPPEQSAFVSFSEPAAGTVELGAGTVRVEQPFATLETSPGWAGRVSDAYGEYLYETLLLEAANGDDEPSAQWGVTVRAENGVITNISAPEVLHGIACRQ